MGEWSAKTRHLPPYGQLGVWGVVSAGVWMLPHSQERVDDDRGHLTRLEWKPT